MATYSEEEARELRRSKLGDVFGELFKDIENDLYSIRSHWRIYTALFGTNAERVDLLNSVSGLTAHVVEKALFESSMLSVCRLTDPPGSMRGKSKNVTIQRLPELIEEVEKREALQPIVDNAVESSGFARSWRNKRLAHSDEDVRRGKASVDRASRAAMNGSIESIAEVVRWVGVNLMDTTIVTHPISSLSGDEVSFLEVLYLGDRAKRKRKEDVLEAAKKGDHQRATGILSDLPSWLTVRPKDRFD